MNIKITDSWLREYLETAATPNKIADCLSLCGPSVERLNKIDNEWVYDIEITTNRVDLMSVVGVAREAAAILPQFGTPARFVNPIPKLLSRNISKSTNNKVKVIIKNPKLCPRFSAAVLENITIKPSPQIIQSHLIKAGMRPINNIVDITNYLMKELGQPYHAFDFDKIKNQTMILRSSKKGETITTLDDQTHTLPGDDIVIEDGGARLIDLCGIMGGENSQIDDKTKTILLFVQTYNPFHIRRTSMTLGNHTEAASLFEKSLDPEMTIPALFRGIELVEKFAAGRVTGKIIDIYPHPYKIRTLNVSLKHIQKIIGILISGDKCVQILNSLGIQSKYNQNTNQITAQIPSWRAEDLTIAEDLIEEIARINGYHNLPTFLPSGELPKIPSQVSKKFYLEAKIKNYLSGWGFTEVYTYSMQSEEEIKKANLSPKGYLKIANPLTEDWVYLRKTLTASMLSVISNNQKYYQEFLLFELSNVYLPKKEDLPLEKLMLTLGVLGKDKFFELKGVAEQLFIELGIGSITFNKAANFPSYLQKNNSGVIKSGEKFLGIIGEISAQILNNFGISSNVCLLELDFESLVDLATLTKKYKPIPLYPKVVEDFSFVFVKEQPLGLVLSKIKNLSAIITSVTVSDKFKRNITFRITFQDPKKSLSAKDLVPIRKKLVLTLEKNFTASFKGKV